MGKTITHTIQINASADTKGLKGLSSALEDIEKNANKIKIDSGIAQGISSIAKSINSVEATNLKSAATALDTLGKSSSKIKIGNNVTSGIKSIGKAITDIHSENLEKSANALGKVGRAIKSIDDSALKGILSSAGNSSKGIMALTNAIGNLAKALNGIDGKNLQSISQEAGNSGKSVVIVTDKIGKLQVTLNGIDGSGFRNITEEASKAGQAVDSLNSKASKTNNSIGNRNSGKNSSGSSRSSGGGIGGGSILAAAAGNTAYGLTIENAATKETNKATLKGWGGDYEKIYNQIDKATDNSLVSMNRIVPSMNAFKSATGATAEQMGNHAQDIADFGTYVESLGYSSVIADGAMMDLSKGLDGAFESLNQFGVSEARLKSTGYWNGEANDIEGYMRALKEVTAGVDNYKDTFNYQKKQMEKDFSRGGAALGNVLLDPLKGVMKSFTEWDTHLMDTKGWNVGTIIAGATQIASAYKTVKDTLCEVRDEINAIRDGFNSVKDWLGGKLGKKKDKENKSKKESECDKDPCLDVNKDLEKQHKKNGKTKRDNIKKNRKEAEKSTKKLPEPSQLPSPSSLPEPTTVPKQKSGSSNNDNNDFIDLTQNDDGSWDFPDRDKKNKKNKKSKKKNKKNRKKKGKFGKLKDFTSKLGDSKIGNIASKLSGSLSKVFSGLQGKIGGFASKISGLFTKSFKGLGGKLGGILGKTMGGLKGAFSGIKGMFGKLGSGAGKGLLSSIKGVFTGGGLKSIFGGLKGIFSGLGGKLGGFLSKGLGKVLGGGLLKTLGGTLGKVGLKSLLGGFLALTGPIGWVIDAVMILTTVLDLLGIDYWTPLCQGAQWLAGIIGGALGGAFDWLKGKASEVWPAIQSGLQWISQGISGLVQNIGPALSGAFEWIKSVGGKIWDGLCQGVQKVWPTLQKVGSIIWDTVKPALDAIANVDLGGIVDWFTSLVDKALEFAGTLSETIGPALGKLGEIGGAIFGGGNEQNQGNTGGTSNAQGTDVSGQMSQIQSMMGTLQSISSTIQSNLSSIASGIATTIASMITTIGSSLNSVLTPIATTIMTTFTTVASSIASMVPSVMMLGASFGALTISVTAFVLSATVGLGTVSALAMAGVFSFTALSASILMASTSMMMLFTFATMTMAMFGVISAFGVLIQSSMAAAAASMALMATSVASVSTAFAGLGGIVAAQLAIAIAACATFASQAPGYMTTAGNGMKNNLQSSMSGIADTINNEMAGAYNALASWGDKMIAKAQQIGAAIAAAMRAGMEVGSPGLIWRTMEAEMRGTTGALSSSESPMSSTAGQVGRSVVDSFNQNFEDKSTVLPGGTSSIPVNIPRVSAPKNIPTNNVSSPVINNDITINGDIDSQERLNTFIKMLNDSMFENILAGRTV